MRWTAIVEVVETCDQSLIERKLSQQMQLRRKENDILTCSRWLLETANEFETAKQVEHQTGWTAIVETVETCEQSLVERKLSQQMQLRRKENDILTYSRWLLETANEFDQQNKLNSNRQNSWDTWTEPYTVQWAQSVKTQGKRYSYVQQLILDSKISWTAKRVEQQNSLNSNRRSSWDTWTEPYTVQWAQSVKT